MATNVYPIQERTIDPYAEYNSNCVNKLTRMTSKGVDCILGNCLQITTALSNPSTHLTLSPGKCFKDDVLIDVTETFTFDMTDPAFYLQGSVGRDIVGIYYIVIDYDYVKARPAPKASIKILKPDQHVLLSGYLFLKAIEVVFNSGLGRFVTNNLFDWDPTQPENQRIYNILHAASVNTLPQWTPSAKTKIIYTLDENELYFGNEYYWESFSGIRDNMNTSGMIVGQAGYLHSDGTIHPAISTDRNTVADCIVMSIGTTDGKVRLYGKAPVVNTQYGITLHTGDKLFLSKIEAGTVTNVVPITGYSQKIGICIKDNLDGTCYIWFMPNEAYDTQILAIINELQAVITDFPRVERKTIHQSDWILDPSGFYYYLVGNAFGSMYCSVTCVNITSGHPVFQVNPQDIGFQLANPQTSTRLNDVVIWMPNNDLDMEVTLIG